MSTWLSETEFREGGAESAGVTINVAFLQEIKDDFEFRSQLNRVYAQLHPKNNDDRPSIRVAADLLGDLRDELKTYFALEEFYGYFGQAKVDNPRVSKQAGELQTDHEKLFLQLGVVFELSQQLVYDEGVPDLGYEKVAEGFEDFCIALAQHEQAEMELMMRLWNEDFGVGD